VDKGQRGKFRHLSTSCPPIWWAFLLAKDPVSDATTTTAASRRSGFFYAPKKPEKKPGFSLPGYLLKIGQKPGFSTIYR
jgi:hypothetical protein